MPKATQKQTKEHNTSLILKTIYEQDGTSRAEIARTTRLTKTTVSSIVVDLMQEGLVEEIGFGNSDGGKPPILLSVVDDARCFIGIDLVGKPFGWYCGQQQRSGNIATVRPIANDTRNCQY